jgi:small subunit ribosomal protein S6
MADMHKYETIFITKPDLTEDAHTAIVEKFKALIEKNGKVESVEDWGVKKLAYAINYIREGHYVLVNFEYHGPDSREHPIVKKVIEAGGLMRKSVSGKTNYLVLNNHAALSGSGKKCRDALSQIDKGKDITIITVDNLLEILGQ